jgi:hypothetical protein
MTSICDGTFTSTMGSRVRIGCAICILLLVAAFTVPCRAEKAPLNVSPKVLMVQSQNDEGLYKAIRAQLSASSLILNRVELDGGQAGSAVTLKSAARSARENGAAMVFWIEDNETCTMYFYLPDSSGGRFNTRSLNLDLSSSSSRFEVIALVAADIIEELLISHNSKPKPRPPAQMQRQETISIAKRDEKVKSRRLFEIFAAYTGSLFAESKASHGILLGLGILPIDRLVLAASFTQNLPLRSQDDEVRLTIVSRQVEVLAAGRILIKPVDIRMGLAWSIDLRTVSATSVTGTIRARSDKFMGVQSLAPFVSAAWIFSERIGLFARVGVNLAVNDTVYNVSHPDLTKTDVLDPFIAKLTYQLGLLVQI